MLNEMIDYYSERDQDPGYRGEFDRRYTSGFSKFMGGGFASLVSSGTAALYVAIAALDLPRGSDVLVSPITDPGTMSAVILNGLRPRLVDTDVDSFSISTATITQRWSSNTSAILVVHPFGRAAEVGEISRLAKTQGVALIEDCSQSHGALHHGRMVGTFGDIAAFSTMYRKIHTTGGSGGVVYTMSQDLHRHALARSDRGKPRWLADFNDRDPRKYLYPALNLNSDEFAAAIGLASIARLDETIAKRRRFVRTLVQQLEVKAPQFKSWLSGVDDSPFVVPIMISGKVTKTQKLEVAHSLLAQGVGLNPDYHFLAWDCEWLRPYLTDNFEPFNARKALDKTFFLYVNEAFAREHADYIVDLLSSASGPVQSA